MTIWHEGSLVDRAGEVVKRYNGTYFSYGKNSYLATNILCPDIAQWLGGEVPDLRNIKNTIRSDMYHTPSCLLVAAVNTENNAKTIFVLKSVAQNAVEPHTRNMTVDAFFYERATAEKLLAKDKVALTLIESYDDLDFSFPALGYINAEVGAVFVARTPKRQYRRALCAESVEIEHNDLFKTLRHKLGLHGVAHTQHKIMHRILFPEYLGAKDALKKLVSGKTYAVAVTKNVCICFLPNRKYFGILYKELYVGHVVENLNAWEINIVPEAAPFKEELMFTLGGLLAKDRQQDAQ